MYNFTMNKVLFEELKKIYNGDILYKTEDLYPYAYDTSPNPKEIITPEFVVFPTNTQQVSKTVILANKHNIALIARGAGTCHCGGCRVKQRSIVIHFSKMDKILFVIAGFDIIKTSAAQINVRARFLYLLLIALKPPK